MTEAALNHPGDEALRALSLGQLTEIELAHVSAHLSDCPSCCRRIDQLATDDRLLARLQQRAADQETVLVTPAQRRAAVRALRLAHEARSTTQEREPDAVPVILPAPTQVGDYDILAEVGRGGMGVVYKARHRGLHRLAALKMVLAGEFASSVQELRFRLEAELAARMHHPNIVQVYEIGNYQGRPFLVLEWIEGGSLANRLDGKPWPPGEAAALIETLARAIDVAHGEGVVHRDLKPANVLLAAGGLARPGAKPPAASVPKITDFGLAQTIEGGPAMTQSGILVGTPEYMAPEQASGKRALVGPATDIYALGVILYQLITGQLPFQGDSTLELLRAVTSDEPTRPRRLWSRLPHDLETICLKCLAKESHRRYTSAEALAEDLHRFLVGEPVQARPAGRLERVGKWARRRPTLAALLLVTVLGAAGIVWKYLDAEQQRIIALGKEQDALREADKANKARDFLVSIFQFSDPNGPQGSLTPRQILDEAEKSIPEKFADQPELQKELLADIERVYAKITANAPLAMILEARGTVQLQSTRDPKQQAVPQALLYLGDRLSLGADGQVQLVVVSDLHKERLQPGREVTVRRKGCEPADAVRERDQDILMTFVPLPKGTFYMGWGGEPRREHALTSSATIVLQGQPFATVALLDYQRKAPVRGWKTEIKEDFEIAVHDVTQGQWEAIMGNNPSSFCRVGGSRSEVKDFTDEELKLFPVELVSWDDVQEFLKKLNEKYRDSGYLYRLPTEAEWEYACRGGATSEEECSYHFYFARPTNELSSDQANFNGSSPFGTAPPGKYLARVTRVGAYPPNKLGLCDMHGNVFQWCADLFDPRRNRYRVLRGGGWTRGAADFRAANRYGNAPTDRRTVNGFRLVRVPVRPK